MVHMRLPRGVGINVIVLGCAENDRCGHGHWMTMGRVHHCRKAGLAKGGWWVSTWWPSTGEGACPLLVPGVVGQR